MRLTDLGLAKVILQDPSLRFGRYVMTGGTGSLKYMVRRRSICPACSDATYAPG